MNQIDRKAVSSIMEMKTFSGWINVTTNLLKVVSVTGQRPIIAYIFATYTATKYNQVNTPAAITALPEVKSVCVTKWSPTESQIIIRLSVENTKTNRKKRHRHESFAAETKLAPIAKVTSAQIQANALRLVVMNATRAMIFLW